MCLIRANTYNSGQRLDDVIQTRLVLASGKLVLQKSDMEGPGSAGLQVK